MTPEETALRAELAELAAQPRGRSLLQLALRGLQDESRGLTAGSGGVVAVGLSPALGGAMSWSTNAEAPYTFEINRVEPLRIPLLSRLTGPEPRILEPPPPRQGRRHRELRRNFRSSGGDQRCRAAVPFRAPGRDAVSLQVG